MILSADNTSDPFERVTKYGDGSWYTEYSDDKYFYVSETKDITTNSGQTNLTQEDNSQLIPFEIPRYYDGVDLSSDRMTIQIHYVRPDGGENYTNPINVMRNTSKIRFGWLVTSDATQIAGTLKFEIVVIGTNEKGDAYLWRTRPSNGLTVEMSLSGNGFIKPDDYDNWYLQFVNEINAKVQLATDAATAARQAANDAAAVTNAYTKAEVDELLANLSALSNLNAEFIDGELRFYDLSKDPSDSGYVIDTVTNIDTLENLHVTFDRNASTGIGTLSFYDGDPSDVSAFQSVTIDLNPTDNWWADKISGLDTRYYKVSPSGNDPKIDDAIDAKISTYDTGIQQQIAAIETQKPDLSEYYKSSEVDTLLEGKADVSTVNGLSATVSTLQTNVTTASNNAQTALDTANTAASNITTLNSTVGTIQEQLNNIDLDQTYTYSASYDTVEGTDGKTQNWFTLWEIENEGESGEKRKEKSKFQITGGGGGGAQTGVTIVIKYVTQSPVVALTGSKVTLTYNYSALDANGDPDDVGSTTWRIGSTVVGDGTCRQGDNTVDVTAWLTTGSQKLTLTCTATDGSIATKTWTIQVVDVKMTSDFNDTITRNPGDVEFTYTPSGSISKVVHFILDGNTLPSVTTSASGISQSYTLKSLAKGSHLLETYITANINGTPVETDHIFKDIIIYDGSSIVIGCQQQNISMTQYDVETINYYVYNPNTETPTVTLAVDGTPISTIIMDSSAGIWQYQPTDFGSHTLTITCGTVVKTIYVTVSKLDVKIKPVTSGLVFDFSPVGKSNNSQADIDWSYTNSSDVKTCALTTSDNFDWVNGGYQTDKNGEACFVVKAGTTATFSHQLFADEAKENGKEFKLVFATHNVARVNTTFLSCFSDNIGLQMKAHTAYISSNTDTLDTAYSEGDVIEFEFNISSSSSPIPMLMTYEDGVARRPLVYSASALAPYTQNNPVPITIGSEYCDVYIYRMKAYNRGLSDSEILSNFIADARSATEMISRYNRNQIYDENGNLTAEALAEACPDIRVIKIDAPYFTASKSDFIKNTTVTQIYKGGRAKEDNWTFTNGYHSGQGTTSNEYGDAGRNIDIYACFDGNYTNSKITYDENYITSITYGDGSTISNGTGKISLSKDSVPVQIFNIKVNIASSDNANNALLQKRYERYNPVTRVAKTRDSKVKSTMEFYNCAVFLKENDPDLSTHREFNDTKWHFYAIGNIGDSKKTDITRLDDPTDPNECIIEIMDNTLPNSTFPGDAAGIAALNADLFNEKGTYGFRYEIDDITDSQHAANIQAWKDFYNFVVSSSDEDFVANLGNYFVVDSALYYYLFIERYTMIDNVAKNSFWHRAKGADGVYRWDLNFDYDNDTGLGIDNSGREIFTYGNELRDYKVHGDPSTGYVFNAAKSTFFNRIKNLMYPQLQAMYMSRETAGCWSSSSLINEFDEWQSEFPEELWRLDIQRKYIRSYTERNNTRFLNDMLNGRKKYQRRQFERDQEKYMASKYASNFASQDQIMVRGNSPLEYVVEPNYTLYLTPYSDMYLNAVFGNTAPVSIRATAGQTYTIESTLTDASETAVLIYSASNIQQIGDMSGWYVGSNDFSKGTHLSSLILGNSTAGYKNDSMTALGIGDNAMLQVLDLQNITGLTGSLDFTGCPMLSELYANGTNISGVSFADGGDVSVVTLPAVSTLTLKNLSKLTSLTLESYNGLAYLVIENCQGIDSKAIVQSAQYLTNVRLTGIDWRLDDDTLLDRLYALKGINAGGNSVERSIISGKVYVDSIHERNLELYQQAWPDLEITYNEANFVKQYSVEFRDENGELLETQYIDVNGTATDPATRTTNPLVPTKEPTISTVYVFGGWDHTITAVTGNQVYIATYVTSARKYTVTYTDGFGATLQQTTNVPYMAYVPYVGYSGEYSDSMSYNVTGTDFNAEAEALQAIMPRHTIAESSANNYYLFDDWDTSGLCTGYTDGNKTTVGNKVINATYTNLVFSSNQQSGTNSFTDSSGKYKPLSSLSPVEIYAAVKQDAKGNPVANNQDADTTNDFIAIGDEISIQLGHDVTYSDIESHEFISMDAPLTLSGSNYLDASQSPDHSDYANILSVDQDFVLALEYKVTNTNGVIAQCFDDYDSNGFRLAANSSLTWYNNANSVGSGTSRDIVVLRHKAGDTNLYVYAGNLAGNSVSFITIRNDKATSPLLSSDLVFGANKEVTGSGNSYNNYATGTIYWAKVWMADLGDIICRKLASWIHETMPFQVAKYKDYYKADGSRTKATFTFLAKALLPKPSTLSATWPKAAVNEYLNKRVVKAFPDCWFAMLSEIVVPSWAGWVKTVNAYGNEVDTQSTLTESTNAFLTIPCYAELVANPDEYNAKECNNGAIGFMTTASNLVCSLVNGRPYGWLTRSSNASYAGYAYTVSFDESTSQSSIQGYYSFGTSLYIRMMFSI